MKKKVMLILSCLLMSIGLVTAQTRTVTGRVVDQTGESLVSVSVIVKGTQIGVSTDVNGNFSVRIPEDKNILAFRLIGMKTIEMSAKDGMSVVMEEDAELLDEVMVIAYGTAKRSSFTGSAGVVKSDAIGKRQVSNVANALSGSVAGVQVLNVDGRPGAEPTIRVRGVGSLNASNKPLYVVDGMPYNGDVAAINSQDVASMTVLKDAASNALYGARGANGVVLITTKKGQSKDAVITVDVKWGNNSRAVSDYNVLKDPATYYEQFYKGLYNGRIGSGASAADAHKFANTTLLKPQQGGLGYQVYTIPQGQDFIGVNGKLNPNATLGYADKDFYYIPDDWRDEGFKSGNLRQEYNLAISGKTDKMTYYMSGGYLDDSGIIENSGFERFTSRLNVDYRVRNWLKVGANIGFTHSNSKVPNGQTDNNSSGNIFYISNLIAPIYPMYVRNADGSKAYDNMNREIYDFGDNTNFSRPFMNRSNPAGVMALDKRVYKTDAFSGNWFAQLDLYEGLKATATFSYESKNERYQRLYNSLYGQFAASGGIVNVSSNKFTTKTAQFLVNYTKSFGKHNFEVLAGVEDAKYDMYYLSGSKENIYSPNIAELDNAISDPKAYSNKDTYHILGYLSKIQYDYRGEFFGGASFRRDGSSRFHKDNRWGNFWSLSGAWILTENLITELSWLNILKVKASYGEQGNDNLSYNDGTVNYYPYQDQYKITEGPSGHSLEPYYYGNKDLTWEKSQAMNFGFEFDIFKGKLSGEIEYFSRKTTDMLYYRPTPTSTGIAQIPMNIGSMRNSGIEISLNTNIVKNRDLDVNFYVNMTAPKNKILKLHPELNGEQVDGSTLWQEGKSMYRRRMPSYAGVDKSNGAPLWYKDEKDKDGNVTGRVTTDKWVEATRYDTKDLMPRVYGGFGSNINFKGIDISFAFAYQLGGKLYDNTYATLMHGGASGEAGKNWHKDILGAWSTENPNSDIPAINNLTSNINSLSDRFLVSSDYLSLQNVTIGYTLPKSITNKMQIGTLRVYFSGENLALITARKGMDPRQSYTTTGSYRYSPIRSLSGGLSVSF